MSRRNKHPNDPRPDAAHAAAAEAFLAVGELAGGAAAELAEGPANDPPPPPLRLGATVLWRVPEEWRRHDVGERLGAEVPAVVARVHPDGAVDLYPLPPLGCNPLRAELTWRVPPGDCRPLED